MLPLIQERIGITAKDSPKRAKTYERGAQNCQRRCSARHSKLVGYVLTLLQLYRIIVAAFFQVNVDVLDNPKLVANFCLRTCTRLEGLVIFICSLFYSNPVLYQVEKGGIKAQVKFIAQIFGIAAQETSFPKSLSNLFQFFQYNS